MERIPKPSNAAFNQQNAVLRAPWLPGPGDTVRGRGPVNGPQRRGSLRPPGRPELCFESNQPQALRTPE